jgi:hypothetical protein
MTTALVVAMPVDTFLDLLPFHPYRNQPWWIDGPLSVAEVLSCAAPDPGRRDWGGDGQPRSVHTARVAHLVRSWVNDGTDPPDVEVFRGVIVQDGWHRIAAAIARNDQMLLVELCGFMSEAAEYGFPIPAHLLQDA